MLDTPLPAGQRPAAAAPEPIRVEYVPRDGLLGLTLINLLLTIVTLTIYRFWAKTKVRRHIWSCVHINGQPLEYTGKGSELFKGFLLVFGLFILPVVLLQTYLQIIAGPDNPWAFFVLGFLQFAFIIFIWVFWGFAIYRARRYQLSRTLWRGIRGTLTGSALSFTFINFGAILLRSITLGWSTPAMNLNIQERLIGDMRFGSMPFRFKGRAGPLYKPYALCWFGTGFAILLVFVMFGAVAAALQGSAFMDSIADVFRSIDDDSMPGSSTIWHIVLIIALVFAALLIFPVIQGVIWAFYTARELAIFSSYTTFGPARFHFDATAGSLIGLGIGNLLILIFTLGIGMPFIQQRLVRYLCDRITVEGLVDVDLIAQSSAELSRTGEGFADAFDVGGI